MIFNQGDGTWVCHCDDDGCPERIALIATEYDDFASRARLEGWDVNDVFDKCPRHNKETFGMAKARRQVKP